MAINIVDRDKLDAALTATASAIRAKTGGSGSIAFDMATDLGFKNAVDAIPTGGGGDVTWDEIAMRTTSGNATGNASFIDYCAFYGFPLTTASFPACTTIGSNAFSKCSSLTTVSFPACTTISGYAFHSCTNLTTASFPACSSIGVVAFSNCNSLTTASFPACTTIGSSAFYSCWHLLSFYLLGSSIPALRDVKVFYETPISSRTTSTGGRRGSIIVQASMLDAFKSATNWSVYSSRFSVWNGVD